MPPTERRQTTSYLPTLRPVWASGSRGPQKLGRFAIGGRQGYSAEALPHLEKAQDTAALGIAQLETGQLRDAVTNLQAALAKRPDDPDLLYYFGRASGLLSKQFIDTLLATYPDSARAHQAMAENYYVLRQMPQAEKEFQQAIEQRPDTPKLHLELGLVYAGASQWAKAEEAFRAETKLQPGNAEAIYRPGFLQADELARWYAHAAAFVHPSLLEPWGLVVNEAAPSVRPGAGEADHRKAAGYCQTNSLWWATSSRVRSTSTFKPGPNSLIW